MWSVECGYGDVRGTDGMREHVFCGVWLCGFAWHVACGRHVCVVVTARRRDLTADGRTDAMMAGCKWRVVGLRCVWACDGDGDGWFRQAV